MNGAREGQTDSGQASPWLILHSHLEGSILPSTLIELARKNDVLLPFSPSDENIARQIEFGGWETFLQYYSAICSCLNDQEDFQIAIERYGERLTQEGVVYAELHCTPWSHVSRGIALDEIAYGLYGGMVNVENSWGTKLKIIFDYIRTEDEDTESIFSWICSLPRSHFVGIGFSGSPKSRPFLDYARLGVKARQEGLGVVAHAGELEGPESVRQALEYLEASRLSHGIRAIEDECLLARIIQSGVHLELCPTSNRLLGVGLANYDSIRQLVSLNVNFSVNPDDELLFNTTVSKEYEILMQQGVFCHDDISEILVKSARSAFASQQEVTEIESKLRSLTRPMK